MRNNIMRSNEGGSGKEGERQVGFVALVGLPNVGKSTLINCLTGAKVSIVTHKAQTTRKVSHGIAIEKNSQIIFVDTPGIFTPQRALDKMMVRTAWKGAASADIIALIVDTRSPPDAATIEILDWINKKNIRSILIINKIDLARKEGLLSLTGDLNTRASFDRTFMISAKTGNGTASVMSYLASALPFGPWLYPDDQVSGSSMRVLAAEITREKLFLRLHDEVPYMLSVETSGWKVLPSGYRRIEQTIYVARRSQRKLVLGKGGETIKQVGIAARREIESVSGLHVHLFLSVKVGLQIRSNPEPYGADGALHRK
ncbi:MAG: GTPase Era [Alphaproteobacteria bacterium]|nr:GTPase Era [Alphaproteobacteria bacterium]